MSLPLPETVQTAVGPVPVTLLSPAGPEGCSARSQRLADPQFADPQPPTSGSPVALERQEPSDQGEIAAGGAVAGAERHDLLELEAGAAEIAHGDQRAGQALARRGVIGLAVGRAPQDIAGPLVVLHLGHQGGVEARRLRPALPAGDR